ncbi:hypothetical protein [Micromonospora lutea]|uniref:PPE family protein n=1 Tax=Micromonospora lutea TaxID=419825 RepID=A0ABQ4INT6_9ACTN|nr:hypothetical protein [Micromonospora lutea]GIJ19568.1 hypothetical protein Vlu01_01920 [Micromonospora lutea]
MREPGVGRSGLTEWHLMNVADMWACLQGHHTDNHWRHVAGWRKVAELAGQHLERLRTYRARLAQVWPPDTNAASRAYLAKLDELIEQVQRTHDAAATNQTTLSAATQALSSSRVEIQKIYAEYAGKLQQRRAWEQTAADPKAAAASRAIQPPVTDSDLERLNIQARNIMYGLSTELQQAQTLLRHPPAQVVRHGDRSLDPVDPYSIVPAPVIPPIAPSLFPANVKTSTRTNLSSQHASTPSLPRTGPVLGSAGQTPAPARTDPRATTPSVPNQAAPPALGIATPSLGSVDRRVGPGVLTPPEDSKNPHPKPTNHARGRLQVGQTHNGLISSLPGAGSTQPNPVSNQPRRINPISGIIGGGAAGTAPAGSAGSRPASRGFPGVNHNTPGGSAGNIGTVPAAGYRSERNLKADDPPEWDPDHPWKTKQGVEPVLKPPEDHGPMDPGPAIGFTK